MQDMADNVECGKKVCFNPRAVIAEIDDTLATRPRNCDVFADALWDTISRAWQDWLLTPEFNKRKIGGMKEFCYWFLGPAEEERGNEAVSDDVPFTETVRRYNDLVAEATKKEDKANATR